MLENVVFRWKRDEDKEQKKQIQLRDRNIYTNCLHNIVSAQLIIMRLADGAQRVARSQRRQPQRRQRRQDVCAANRS